jgi:hypothetical protein
MDAGGIGPIPALPGTVRVQGGDQVGALIGRDARRSHKP